MFATFAKALWITVSLMAGARDGATLECRQIVENNKVIVTSCTVHKWVKLG